MVLRVRQGVEGSPFESCPLLPCNPGHTSSVMGRGSGSHKLWSRRLGSPRTSGVRRGWGVCVCVAVVCVAWLGCDHRVLAPGALGFLGEKLSRHSWATTLGARACPARSPEVLGLSQVIGSD